MVKDMSELEFRFLITFLDRRECFGEHQLDILKKYGTRAAITDFAILLGGGVADYCHTSEGNSRKDLAGSWWTSLLRNDGEAYFIQEDGGGRWKYRWNADYPSYVGARPALPYLSTSQIFANAVSGANGILEVEYGEYPQTVVSRDLNEILESAYSDRTIVKTGKRYTTNLKFRGVLEHIEYEYNEKKYIRFVAHGGYGKRLSDGTEVEKGRSYWVEVEPIKWMIDEKTNIVLSKKILFAGIEFANKRDYPRDFRKTFIYQFMNEHFSKDIIPSKINKEVDFQQEVRARVASLEKLVDELKAELNEEAASAEIIAKINAEINAFKQRLNISGGGNQYVKQ